MSDYLQGITISLIANYTDGNGTPILVGISGVTADIYHFNGGTKFFDLVSGTLTQDPDDANRFNRTYKVSGNATITNHTIEYSALYSGTEVQFTESFGVLPATSTFPTSGIGVPGSVATSGTVVNISGSGLNNVSVTAALLTGNNTIVAGSVTNPSGVYNLQLDPNDYFLAFTADGYSPNQVSKTVPISMSTFNFGQTTLLETGGGSIVISDQYQKGQSTSDFSGAPLSGLRVALFAKGNASAGIADAINVAYTNESGIFSMTAAAGRYVLLIEGRGTIATNVYDTAYDIDIDPVLGNSDFPKNFRYLGTTQYSFI